MEAQQRGEVEGGEHVAVAHEDAILDAFGGEADTARGPERIGLDRVAQLHVTEATARELLRERVGQVPHREHDFVDAVLREPPQLPLEERLVGDRQERLRRLVGEGSESRALAPDEHDGFHGVVAGAVVVVADVASAWHGESLVRIAAEFWSVMLENASHACGGKPSSAPLGRKPMAIVAPSWSL